MHAKEITPSSWIFYDDNEAKVGLLIQKDDQFSLFSKDKISRYNSKAELIKAFTSIVWEERIVVESKTITIGKLPVDSDEIFDLIEGDVTSYKKTKTGRARFVPGYYGLKFSNAYTGSLCPKLITIEQNEHIGPFITKFELDGEIALANRRLNDTFIEEKND